MDFLERKILEIVQTNTEITKDEVSKPEDNMKGLNILEKVSGKEFIIKIR